MSKVKKPSTIVSDYKYGFKTDQESVFETSRGISEAIVRQISLYKQEPEWMTEIRVEAFRAFVKMANPSGDLISRSSILTIMSTMLRRAIRLSLHGGRSRSDQGNVSETGDSGSRTKVLLSGLTSQFDSRPSMPRSPNSTNSGVIFLDTDSALKQYPELFRTYFTKSVSYLDNKYAALNTAVWSGGSFIYVPKGVKIEKPLQSYFRINTERMGQFERTLIIVDSEASLNYVEGCTAPIYSRDSLHAAVVEIFVKDNAYCRYSTVQNWSNNIVNLVTKRAVVGDYGQMEWIDGNIGSGLNMKYPSCILQGESAKGTTISIAFAGKSQHQDTGAKMIHIGKNTASTIISKSIATKGGKVNYRGLVSQGPKAFGAKSKIQCDTILIDALSSSDTLPVNIVKNFKGQIEHEAIVSKVSEEQLFYLMSRGLSEQEATEMIVMGFIEPFSRELPMEYAVELNQLIKFEMTGAIG